MHRMELDTVTNGKDTMAHLHTQQKLGKHTQMHDHLNDIGSHHLPQVLHWAAGRIVTPQPREPSLATVGAAGALGTAGPPGAPTTARARGPHAGAASSGGPVGLGRPRA